MPDIALPGCVPDRLLSYLSALGVLRLIGRQANPDACGFWRDSAFVVRSTLDRAAVERFFLEEYCPTPLVMPWNSGAFSEGNVNSASGKALIRLTDTSNGRFAPFREAAALTRQLLAEFDDIMPDTRVASKKAERKAALLWRCRNELPDAVVEWIDAAVVLTDTKPEYPPLLGSGGNDGRMDFTSNYMQRLADVLLPDADHSRSASTSASQSSEWLRAALFAEGEAALQWAAVGQFDPGSAGGPNATAGFSAASLVNPWQFILALEGALLLAAAATRRLGAGQSRLASIPFTVRALAVGYASAATAEAAGKSRAELWLPTWTAPWSLGEAEQVFSEGRLTVGGRLGRRQAGDAIDVARAIAQLGVDRGIDAFYRYAFLQRSGNAYFAVCVGQLRPPDEPRSGTELLDDIAIWRDQVHREADQAGPGYRSALHLMEEAMFRYAQLPDRGSRLEALLRSMGHMEQEVAQYVEGALRRGAPVRLRPLQGLGPRWVPTERDSSDRGMAIHIALALASIQSEGPRGEIGALRTHLEPAVQTGERWSWGQPGDPTVVWGGGPLERNLCAVLQRRLIEATIRNVPSAPFRARYGVRPGDIARFLNATTAGDDARISDLLWVFNAISPAAWRQVNQESAQTDEPLPPNAYTLLKLALLPPSVTPRVGSPSWSWPHSPQPFEPRLIPLLHAGRVAEAIALAARRLRNDGLPPLTTNLLFAGDPTRLAASLLIPVSGAAIRELERRVLNQPAARTGTQQDSLAPADR